MSEERKQRQLSEIFNALNLIIDDALKAPHGTRETSYTDRAEFDMRTACRTVCNDEKTAACLEAVFDAYAATVGFIDRVEG